jgi:outer membrane protein assembly factor BamE (lipoprotein component of BamABCDE complex)
MAKEVFAKVEIGMTVKEVKNILGDPAETRTGIDTGFVYFYYLYNDTWAKNYSSVYFDKKGFVSLTSYESPG